jgi:prophage regulatory protein
MEPKYVELAQALSNACASPSWKLIRPKDVAAMLGISRKQLYLLAQGQDFPEKIKIGDRAIAWKLSDIEGWIDARSVKSQGVSS